MELRDGRPQARLTVAQRILAQPPLDLPIVDLQRERDVSRQLVEQAHLIHAEKPRLAGIEVQGPDDPFARLQRQRRHRAVVPMRSRVAQHCGVGIGGNVVADGVDSRTQRFGRERALNRPRIEQPVHRPQRGGRGAGVSPDPYRTARLLHEPDPGHGKPVLSCGAPADGRQHRVGIFLPDDGLVHVLQNGVDPIQPCDVELRVGSPRPRDRQPRHVQEFTGIDVLLHDEVLRSAPDHLLCKCVVVFVREHHDRQTRRAGNHLVDGAQRLPIGNTEVEQDEIGPPAAQRLDRVVEPPRDAYFGSRRGGLEEAADLGGEGDFALHEQHLIPGGPIELFHSFSVTRTSAAAWMLPAQFADEP